MSDLDPNVTAALCTVAGLRAEPDGVWSGVRDERFPETLLRQAIAAHEAAGEVLKRDARSLVTAATAGDLRVIVKEVRKTRLRRRLADRFRGAPAARALRAARGLIERGIGAALPLAAVEQRRFGVPVRSLLVSLDLRGDPTAAQLLADRPDQRETVLAALADLLAALHREGARHGDLRAQHTHLGRDGSGSLCPRLIDLESLHFGAEPDEYSRLHDWAQILASIPDAHASTEARRAAVARYAAARPFARSADEAFAEIERRSIGRQHLYRGCNTQQRL